MSLRVVHCGGFMVLVCHYLGALIFGLCVIVCIVCYGSAVPCF